MTHSNITKIMVGALALFSGTAYGASIGVPTVPLTVRDGIRMTNLANYWTVEQGFVPFGVPGAIASFSPHRRKFVIVVRRGVLTDNSNRYTMLLWRVDGDRVKGPEVLIQMNSSSIWPAIDPLSIVWAKDGKSLTFLGEHSGERRQIFNLNIKSRVVEAVTHSPTNIVSYSFSRNDRVLAYEALPETQSLWNAETLRHGLGVTDQSLLAILTGKANTTGYKAGEMNVTVVDKHGVRIVHPLSGNFILGGGNPGGTDQDISVSPNGRYVIVVEAVANRSVPSGWREYRTNWVRTVLWFTSPQRVLSNAPSAGFSRYVIINLKSGRSRVLLNSPVLSLTALRPLWSPNSRRVVLSNVLLPIGRGGAKEVGQTTVEVNVRTDIVETIGRGCARAIRWSGRRLICSMTPDIFEGSRGSSNGKVKVNDFRCGRMDSDVCRYETNIEYEKVDGKWHALGVMNESQIHVSLKEGLNSPPEFYYAMGNQKRGHLLWNPNPRITESRLAEERVVRWKSAKGHVVSGGLYYPTDYKKGHRYPLVIQTHGFRKNTFDYFGPFPTAFAAQPLAANGMFVLQLGYVGVALGKGVQGAEKRRIGVEKTIEVYKSAIAYLSRMGLINPRKVGIIGFSMTCFSVDWALTHDPRLFAAASVTEGGDGSPMEYMLGLVTSVPAHDTYGGPPYGRYLKSWNKWSPILNIEHVRAPLLIGVSHHILAIDEWEWLNALRNRRIPVYMVVLDGRSHDSHTLEKPWDIFTSSGDNVAWFDFWLNGRVDRDLLTPRRAAGWKKLRAMYDEEKRRRRGGGMIAE